MFWVAIGVVKEVRHKYTELFDYAGWAAKRRTIEANTKRENPAYFHSSALPTRYKFFIRIQQDLIPEGFTI